MPILKRAKDFCEEAHTSLFDAEIASTEKKQ
jgi:hypothetical protein